MFYLLLLFLYLSHFFFIQFLIVRFFCAWLTSWNLQILVHPSETLCNFVWKNEAQLKVNYSSTKPKWTNCNGVTVSELPQTYQTYVCCSFMLLSVDVCSDSIVTVINCNPPIHWFASNWDIFCHAVSHCSFQHFWLCEPHDAIVLAF